MSRQDRQSKSRGLMVSLAGVHRTTGRPARIAAARGSRRRLHKIRRATRRSRCTASTMPWACRRSRLGWIVLGGGLTGTCRRILLQWWTGAVSYPLVIGGKPLFSIAVVDSDHLRADGPVRCVRAVLRHVGPQRPSAVLPPGVQLLDAPQDDRRPLLPRRSRPRTRSFDPTKSCATLDEVTRRTNVELVEADAQTGMARRLLACFALAFVAGSALLLTGCTNRQREPPIQSGADMERQPKVQGAGRRAPSSRTAARTGVRWPAPSPAGTYRTTTAVPHGHGRFRAYAGKNPDRSTMELLAPRAGALQHLLLAVP